MIPREAKLSNEASKLIFALCQGYKTRLGANGAKEVKDHPFFRDIKFETLRNQKAYYIPKITHTTDTSHFDNFDDMPTQMSTGQSDSDYKFYDFTYRRFFEDHHSIFPCVNMSINEREEEEIQDNETPSTSGGTQENGIYV